MPFPRPHSRRQNNSGYEVPFYINAVYYPNWRIYKQQPPSSLSIGFVSHVFYAFAGLKEDGSVVLTDEWADSLIPVDNTNGCIKAFTQLKQQYTALKVILSIGGGGDGSKLFAQVAANPTAVETFASSARSMVDNYKLDGIDLDWESPQDPNQGINYVFLLSQLRGQLPRTQYLLTAALPAALWALRNIDISAAQVHLDLINLMAYDFSGSWIPQSGHQAQLFAPANPYNEASKASGQLAVSYLLSLGVPSQKILLGIPVYGRSFVGANGVGQTYTGCGGVEGTYEYKDLVDSGSPESVDENLVAASCQHKEGGFVSYDNVHTVKMKATYATQNRLGGLFFWQVTADARGSKSLIKAGFNALHDF